MTGNHIVIGGGGEGYIHPQKLNLKYANRHGLIAGATGTGKSVTLQSLAEEFSKAGVPVFLADAKGDLAGIAKPGDPNGRMHGAFMDRVEQTGIQDFEYRRFPVTIWDVFGEEGVPIRVSMQKMGPQLLGRLLSLTDAQEGVLVIAFSAAIDEGLPIHTIADLRAVLSFVTENYKIVSTRYGNVSPASVGAIQRKVLVLEQHGGDSFFGMPSLDLDDFMQTNRGMGQINLLAAERLMRNPSMYAVFLLWMLTDLFERLPEVGDMDKPKFVFFFDEAHLLFKDATKLVLNTVERVVRLIRSKGVGVYFVTQKPGDIPDSILGQLGNRVQHALRGFTARDMRDINATAAAFRPNPAFSTISAIRDMGIGEALVSFLQDRGVPGVVQRTLIRPPGSRVGPLTDQERRNIVNASPFFAKYLPDDSIPGAERKLRGRGIELAEQESSGALLETFVSYLKKARE